MANWTKLHKTGWLCEDGRYIAKFNWTICYVYLLYNSKAEYEKPYGDYKTFYSLREAKMATSQSDTLVMFSDNRYGAVKLPAEKFNKLDAKYFISGCTDEIKFMCANHYESEHLKSIGIDLNDVCCDWYKLILTKYRSELL